jgi:hypothetical protein
VDEREVACGVTNVLCAGEVRWGEWMKETATEDGRAESDGEEILASAMRKEGHREPSRRRDDGKSWVGATLNF